MASGNNELGTLFDLSAYGKKPLSPEQEDYWYKQLESAERAVEYAKRMLGILAVEKGLED